MKRFHLLLLCLLLLSACTRQVVKEADSVGPAVVATSLDQATTTALAPKPERVDPESPTPTRTSSQTPTPRATSTPSWCAGMPAGTSNTSVPSGRLHLAYASAGDLWLWEEGGGSDSSSYRLTRWGDVKQVSISDDGQRVAFTRQITQTERVDLWVVYSNGNNPHRLLSAEELMKIGNTPNALAVTPFEMDWMPGTHILTFSTYPTYDGIWIYEPSDLWLLDADTGKLEAAQYRGGGIPSPDGKQIAIFRIPGISLIDRDGSHLRENVLPAADDRRIGMGESYYYPQPDWAMDSRSLLVAVPDQEEIFEPETTTTIWYLPVDGSPAKKISHIKAFAPSVTFSPDHQLMAYWPWPEGSADQRELHIARVDGSEDMIYTRGILIYDLVWSPDGQHFIFWMGNPNQPYLGQLCHPPRRLLDEKITNDGSVEWIDANRYLLTIHKNEADDLLLGTLDTSQSERFGVVIGYDWVILR